jgi:hypothetical protein
MGYAKFQSIYLEKVYSDVHLSTFITYQKDNEFQLLKNWKQAGEVRLKHVVHLTGNVWVFTKMFPS